MPFTSQALPISLYRIFCPRCGNLTLADTSPKATNCSQCGWQRPGQKGGQAKAILKLATSVQGNPLAWADRLCLTTEEGEVVVLDLFTLRERARVVLQYGGQALQPSVDLAGDAHHLYAGTACPQALGAGSAPLLALRWDDLAVVWSRPTNGLRVSGPALWAGVVYAAASDQEAWAIQADTGQVLWRRPLGVTWSPDAPATNDELVVFPSRSRRIAALERASGRPRWTFDSPGGDFVQLPTSPLLAEDRVYVAGWDGCLHCLDQANGQVVWSYRTQSGKELLTAPVAAGSLILAGGRDHLLHAVDRDGHLVWTYDTGRRIYSRPLVIEGEVYVAGDDKRLHALDLETGRPLWPQPLPLEERVRAALASDGVYVLAVDDHGAVWRAPRLLRPLREATVYEAEGRLDLAAVAHTLAGRHERAAALCDEGLNLPVAAARLYERAGRLDQAAIAYERAGLHEKAEQCYRQMGDWSSAADLAQRAGRLADAAHLYEKEQRWAEAAALYERLGQFAQAGALYRRANDGVAALRCFERTNDQVQIAEELLRQGNLAAAAGRFAQAGEPARAAEVYVRAGDLLAAARVCEQAGDFLEAAQYLEQAGQNRDAVRLYRQDGSRPSLERALALCQQEQDWAQGAEVLALLGREREAGERLLAVARQREQETGGKAEAELAELFGRVVTYFDRAGLLEGQEPRWSGEEKMRYYCRLPDLRVVPRLASRSFSVGEVNSLRVEVVNVGRGKANNVHIHLKPALAALSGELEDKIPRISDRGGQWEPYLSFETLKPGVITLRCQLRYHDDEGQAWERQQRWEIEVKDRDQTGTQVFHIHEGGRVYQSDREINVAEEGDILMDQAQKGDRVTVERRNREMQPVSRPLACPHCSFTLAAGAAFCDNCGKAVGK